MNSNDIFNLALGLKHPWEVRSIRFEVESDSKRILYIEIGFEKGSKFPDSSGKQCEVHDSKLRTWRHLNFFQHECYIQCKVPRIINSEGKVKQVEVPWARSGSGFTLLFEAFAMSLIEHEMPVNGVGEIVDEYPNRIWTIFNHWLSIAYDAQEVSDVKCLGIDETSTRKGHNYVTVAVDMEESRVVKAVPGKGSDTVTKIKVHLEEKGCKSDQIEKVCIDLSPAYISGVTREFEQAQIVFDRFHIKKLLNEAMDEVRKREVREHDILKGHRYLFLKGNKKLSARQKEQREELIELLPNIGEAYRLKLLFDDFWQMSDPEEAAGFLAFWCDLVEESKIQPFIKFKNTINSHWTGIVNYIESRISNGILEGINSKIQLAKRRARGFGNINNFINMIYFIAGKLNFDYPHRST